MQYWKAGLSGFFVPHSWYVFNKKININEERERNLWYFIIIRKDENKTETKSQLCFGITAAQNRWKKIWWRNFGNQKPGYNKKPISTVLVGAVVLS